MLSPISTRLLTSALVESPKESSLRYKIHPPTAERKRQALDGRGMLFLICPQILAIPTQKRAA